MVSEHEDAFDLHDFVEWARFMVQQGREYGKHAGRMMLPIYGLLISCIITIASWPTLTLGILAVIGAAVSILLLCGMWISIEGNQKSMEFSHQFYLALLTGKIESVKQAQDRVGEAYPLPAFWRKPAKPSS